MRDCGKQRGELANAVALGSGEDDAIQQPQVVLPGVHGVKGERELGRNRDECFA